MDNKKSQKSPSSSSSSITSQLFGTPESDVLASIFPPSKGAGRNSGCLEGKGSWQKEASGSGNQPWSGKQDNTYNNSANKEHSSMYHQEGAEPSYLSSSIYYGGQEMYSRSATHQTPASYPKYKKDDQEEDPSDAARGNWWQGSLYY